MSEIKTARLVLRKFTPADAADLLEYHAAPTVNCFMSETLESLAAAELNVAERMSDDLQFAVYLPEEEKVIGNLFAHFEEPDTYSVCWHFNPEYGGKGYATEAASAYLAYFFEGKNARRVYAYVEDDNSPSQKLCERLGMRQEGLFKEFISFVNNSDGTEKYENTYQYALLKKEWLEQASSNA